MKWWADERKAVLRPEQRFSACFWATIAMYGAAAALVMVLL